MKARIKATGEVVDVVKYGDKYQVFGSSEFYSAEELVFLLGDYPQGIDWESRTWQAAVAIMQGLMSDDISTCRLQADAASKEVDFTTYVARVAIDFAKALVAEYRKGE